MTSSIPTAAKKLVADRKVSTAIAHSILRDTPSAALCPQLFPFLNLINSERMIWALAAPGETALTSCPVVVIDDQSESPSLLAGDFSEFVTLLPWGHQFIVEIAEYVSMLATKTGKRTMKNPAEKFAPKLAKYRKHVRPLALKSVAATPAKDPGAVIVKAYTQHDGTDWQNLPAGLASLARIAGPWSRGGPE